MPTNNYIRVIERMTRVLESFEGRTEVPLGELTTRARMVKSSVFRILYTLERLGYVEKSAGGRYSLTSRFKRLAGDARPNPAAELAAVAHPFMQDLVRRFQETVNLGVLDEDEVLYIRVVESPHAFRLAAHAGIRSPLHSTALGKCLLCRASTEELDRMLDWRNLRRFTSRTICDRAGLLREFTRVRKRGYAVDNMEDSDGARCFAVPIQDAQGRVIAALSVSGPASRLDRKRESEIAAGLKSVSRHISKLLGYSSDRVPLAGTGV